MRLIALLAALLTAAPAAAWETRRVTLEHDGRTRAAILDAARDLRDAPLLIVLHGGIGGASIVRRRAAVTLPARGWAVLWPEAVNDWSDGRRDRTGRLYDDEDDVGFLRALAEGLAAQGVVDLRRVYVAGPSIGGMMTLRMVCEAPDLVAGAAVAIAALPEGLDCPDAPPTPILFLHSTADEIVPPRGGRIGGDSMLVRDRGRVTPIDDTIAFFARRNRCGGYAETAIPDRDPTDGSTAVRRDYAGCAAPLIHYVVEGAGHTWPGSRPFRLGAALIGETNQDFAATAELERFFEGLAARD
jgi:polyhydroxybutyrate depolymerase